MNKLVRVAPYAWRFRWPEGFLAESARMDKAIDLAEAGNGAEAERILRECLRRSPEHIDVMQALAQVLHHTGRRPEAELLWVKAVEVGKSAFPPRAFRIGRDLLEWVWLENRPFLRCMRGLMYHTAYDRGDEAQALILAGELLALNPRDNQAVRASAMSWLLRAGRDADAIDLAARDPDDFLPDTTYGHALALFRTGRRAEADEVLASAIRRLPAVTHELLKSTHRAPRGMNPSYETIGGADQAYQYWKADGVLWAGTGGALTWLRSVFEHGQGADETDPTGQRL